MLSETKYAGLCVLGMEIFYVLCIVYGLLLSGKAQDMGAVSGVAGWYISWMHNASLIRGTK